jgi:hypothetical protein
VIELHLHQLGPRNELTFRLYCNATSMRGKSRDKSVFDVGMVSLSSDAGGGTRARIPGCNRRPLRCSR